MIEFENISIQYEGKTVMSNFSTSIKEAQIVAIIGQSGVGKTSLIQLLLGLKKPSAGKVKGLDKLTSSVVFQENRLCENLSCELNIRMVLNNQGHKRSKEQVRAYVNDHLEQLLPKDIGGQLVKNLSGGMKRRVAIARAVAVESNLLILDEPFTGLDEENRELTIQYILRNRRDRTLIFVTHQNKDIEMMHADQVIELQAPL